ncbi:hypothetical protein [Streptomyces sasae]|uniref:hypothetical protein n=1 Tax=Streptomyces sasae TaxID=1266772 RepID=UPI00292CD444|nr:hypothetical protein [Streptomyces sasae]
MIILLLIAAATFGLGYLLGRLRPWRQLGYWAEDQVRFAGWVDAGLTHRLAVVIAFALTRPRESWRIARAAGQAPRGTTAR